jgi:hypothetical protein
VVCFAGILTGPVQANTLLLNVTEDTFLNQAGGHFSNSGGSTVNYMGSGNNYTSLLRFDLSGLGALAGATINSVSLNLTSAGGTAVTQSFFVYQMAAANFDWVEGSGNFSDGVLGASNDYKNNIGAVGWASGTPFYFTNDIRAGNVETTPLYYDYIANLVSGSTYSFALSNSMITDWLGNSAMASAGLVYATDNLGSFAGFYSSEYANAAFRPTLLVNYTAVPEPGSLALGGVGLMALMVFHLRRKAWALI